MTITGKDDNGKISPLKKCIDQDRQFDLFLEKKKIQS